MEALRLKGEDGQGLALLDQQVGEVEQSLEQGALARLGVALRTGAEGRAAPHRQLGGEGGWRASLPLPLPRQPQPAPEVLQVTVAEVLVGNALDLVLELLVDARAGLRRLQRAAAHRHRPELLGKGMAASTISAIAPAP